MSDTQRELAVITAHIYRPGDIANHDDMLNAETDLWAFSDPDAGCVWDVLEDEDARPDVKFASRAIHILFQFVPNPNRWLSKVDSVASFLQEAVETSNLANPDLIFGVIERYLAGLEAQARRHNYEEDDPVEEIALMGLFEVEIAERSGVLAEGYTVIATFLGELDVNRLLPTSSALEVQILKHLRDDGLPYVALGLALKAEADAFEHAISALKRDGLIEKEEMLPYPARYMLTSYGRAVIA
jgi:hypothetical protein